MWEKIVAFFMSIIAFLASLFGFNISPFEAVLYENISYGEHERNVLDLYLPETNDGEIGLILLIHGGAWVAGDKSGYSSAAEEFCENYGYATATMNYRYVGNGVTLFDVADDISAALAKIKETAAQKGVEINKVLLTGASAGGHLSMFYAYSRADEAAITPVAVVNYCGPTDLTDEKFYIDNDMGDSEFLASLFSMCIGETFTYAQRAEYAEKLKAVSPLYYVNENTVPTAINHGMKDTIVPFSNATALAEALEANGVKYDFNAYPNSGHGLSSDKESQKTADKLMESYAATYLGVESAD